MHTCAKHQPQSHSDVFSTTHTTTCTNTTLGSCPDGCQAVVLHIVWSVQRKEVPLCEVQWASGLFPDGVCVRVCGTCRLKLHLTNTHPPLCIQCCNQECALQRGLHGFLQGSLINTDNQIGYKKKKTVCLQGLSLGYIQTQLLKDIKNHLFYNIPLARSYFRLIFMPLFLPDLIKWDQTFQQSQHTLHCLADVQSVAPRSLCSSLPSCKILPFPQVKIGWRTSMPPTTGFQIKVHRTCSCYMGALLATFFLGGIICLGNIFLKISEFTSTGTEFLTLHFLIVCSSEVKEGPLISTKPGKVKCTQNYDVHPARTEQQRSVHSLFSGDEKKPCRESSVVRELITASILGTVPLWVTEPSM